MAAKHHSHSKHASKKGREEALAQALARQGPPPMPPMPPGPPPGAAGMPPGMPPMPMQPGDSSPHETRESGENTVLIGDGGTPYQRYGPNPAESVDPNADYAAMDDKFSFEAKDTIQRLKPPLPRRQIKDGGGDG
jgi:hypothetical protein